MIFSKGDKNTLIGFILLFFSVFAFSGCGGRGPGVREFPLTVSFRVNFFPVQKALWIEDEEGNYLKTLHASEWLSGYGEEYNVLPDWVESSGEARANKSEQKIHAFTEATLRPRGEKFRYGWDLTDWKGDEVRDRTVRIILQCDGAEGTVVTWSGEINIGEEPARLELPPCPPELPEGLELYAEDVAVEYSPAKLSPLNRTFPGGVQYGYLIALRHGVAPGGDRAAGD